MTGSTLLLSALLVIGFAANDTLAQDSRAQVIATFRMYVELNEDFKSSVGRGNGYSGKPYKQLRKEVEEFAESEYANALDMAKKLICENADAELLAEFLHVLLVTTNSAYEYPSFVLGEIYICNPELVVRELTQLEPSDKSEIYKTLVWGFENATFQKQKEIPNYESLAGRLKNLKPESKE